MSINPHDVDEQTVPVPAPHAALVEVDGGGLLVHEAVGRGFALNATAALLWTLFDSTSPLGELIDDVSAAFAAPREQVADSAVGLVRFFGKMGFLANVTRDIASLPIKIRYADVDECGEPIPAGAADEPTFDERYLGAAPNA